MYAFLRLTREVVQMRRCTPDASWKTVDRQKTALNPAVFIYRNPRAGLHHPRNARGYCLLQQGCAQTDQYARDSEAILRGVVLEIE